MYWLNEYHVAFVCGKKYNETMLKNEWKKLYNTSNIKIIKEVSVPYTSLLLQNISDQCPEAILNFQDYHGHYQKHIFGYFLFCEKQFNGVGANASHFFTNHNTYNFFSKNIPSIQSRLLEQIQLRLDTMGEKYVSSVVGPAAINLFGGKNITTALTTEIWNQKNNDIGKILEIINLQNTTTVQIKNKKIEWLDDCYMIPSHKIKVIQKGNIVSEDFFFSEKIFCYYKGIKFLYVGGSTTNINFHHNKECLNLPNNKSYKPSKKNRINKVWDIDQNYSTEIYENYSLNFINELKVSEGYWIFGINGNFTIIISKNMFLPWLTRGFIATGKFIKKGSSLNIFPGNKFSSSQIVNKYIQKSASSFDIVLNGFNLHRNTKKIRRPVKKKKIIIQDECKGHNISSFLTLLSRN